MKYIVLVMTLLGVPQGSVASSNSSDSDDTILLTEEGNNHRYYAVNNVFQDDHIIENYTKHMLRITATGFFAPGIFFTFHNEPYGYPIIILGIMLFILSSVTD
jgi:hypothetical protein